MKGYGQMKQNAWMTLILWMLLFAMLFPMAACTKEQENGTETETGGETLPDPIDPESFGKADDTYNCEDDSVLRTYKNKTADDFAGVRSYYLQRGCSVYSESEKAGNLFATLVNGEFMAHVYWLKNSGELNIVQSDTAGETLPPAQSPEIMQGEYAPSVTQMRDSTNVNGMCYIVQLPDGSFIVYDGSYAKRASKVLAQIKALHGEGGTPLIRAWVLTHSHNDHFPTFAHFAENFANQVDVEYVIFAPVDLAITRQLDGDGYFNNAIHEDVEALGATLVYAHTGMEFAFGDFKLEVLLTADDLFKVGNHGGNFNNSSIVTRIYKDDYSMLFLADIGKEGAGWMTDVYGDYLQSDVCQVSHHGVEDVPLQFYETVQASILCYPCNTWLYDQTERHYDVRMALEQRGYTKEILIAGVGQFTRAWGTSFEADAPLSMPEYERK